MSCSIFSRAYIKLLTVLCLLVAVSFLTVVWTYGIFYAHWRSPLVRTVARITNMPAVRVGSRFISYEEYQNNLDAELKFLSGKSAKAMGIPSDLTSEWEQKPLDRIIRIAVVEDMARQQNIVITQQDIDNTLDELLAREGSTSTLAEMETVLLDQFGWNIEDFKNHVIRPALMESALKQKMTESDKDAAFSQSFEKRKSELGVVKFLRFK